MPMVSVLGLSSYLYEYMWGNLDRQIRMASKIYPFRGRKASSYAMISRLFELNKRLETISTLSSNDSLRLS